MALKALGLKTSGLRALGVYTIDTLGLGLGRA